MSATLRTVRRVLDEETRLGGSSGRQPANALRARTQRAQQESRTGTRQGSGTVRGAQVNVGLASRDAGIEAELWAESLRRAIDRTAEGADEALAAIDAVVARQRQLASDDPLAGLRVGLESYANQLPIRGRADK